MTIHPEDLREKVARIEAWCSLIERPAPFGDDRLLVDADVAAEHARDCRSVLSALKQAERALETAELTMQSKGWWRNEAGYLTDAALWIDKAQTAIRQTESMG